MPSSSPFLGLLGNHKENVHVREKYRVVVMGAAEVGKSAIIKQFLFEEFLLDHDATVEELHRAEYDFRGSNLILEILDTAGSYHFPAMQKLAFSSGDAFILVYSIDNAESFEEVRRLRDLIVDTRGPLIPIVVVGNKKDLTHKRQVRKEIAETVVTIDWESGYVETCAKNLVDVVAVFKEVLAQGRIAYALSPALKRRRKSFPLTAKKREYKDIVKRNSCVIS